MNLFDIVEGTKGEDLSSAGLKYLALRSYRVRDACLQVFAEALGWPPIRVDGHFACECEVPFKPREEDKAPRRVDMLWTTDSAVVAVENKFYAQFQDKQVEQYAAFVDGRAKALRSLHTRTYVPGMVVLAPESRSAVVNAEIESISGDSPISVKLVTWERLLRAVEPVLDGEPDPVAQALGADFVAFVRHRVSFFPDFDKWRHLFHQRMGEDREWDQGHYRLLDELKYVLPTGKTGSGTTHIGYGVDDVGFFGFCDTQVLEDNSTDRAVEFVVEAQWEAEERPEPTELRGVHLAKLRTGALSWAKRSIYLIDLQEGDWHKPMAWQDLWKILAGVGGNSTAQGRQ